MLPEPQLSSVLGTLGVKTIHGPFSRCVPYHHLLSKGGVSGPKPLWGLGSKTLGARFTPRGSFETVYLAEDPITALAEVSLIFNLPQVPSVTMQNQPWVIMSVHGIVLSALDLTDPGIVSRLGSNHQELTGAWRLAATKPGGAPTQILGQACYQAGRFDGIRYFSSKNSPNGVCVAVLPDRLTPPAYIEVYDPNQNLVQRIP